MVFDSKNGLKRVGRNGWDDCFARLMLRMTITATIVLGAL